MIRDFDRRIDALVNTCGIEKSVVSDETFVHIWDPLVRKWAHSAGSDGEVH